MESISISSDSKSIICDEKSKPYSIEFKSGDPSSGVLKHEDESKSNEKSKLSCGRGRGGGEAEELIGDEEVALPVSCWTRVLKLEESVMKTLGLKIFIRLLLLCCFLLFGAFMDDFFPIFLEREGMEKWDSCK